MTYYQPPFSRVVIGKKDRQQKSEMCSDDDDLRSRKISLIKLKAYLDLY